MSHTVLHPRNFYGILFQIYMLLWFWFVGLTIVSLVSVVYWCLLLFPQHQRNFVSYYITIGKSESEVAVLQEFVKKLTPSGLLLMKTISIKTNKAITGMIFEELLKIHLRHQLKTLKTLE